MFFIIIRFKQGLGYEQSQLYKNFVCKKLYYAKISQPLPI